MKTLGFILCGIGGGLGGYLFGPLVIPIFIVIMVGYILISLDREI